MRACNRGLRSIRKAPYASNVVLRNRSAGDIDEAPLPRLAPDAELFSDGAKAYRTLAMRSP